MNTNKIAWVTDIHLNFLKPAGRKKFYKPEVQDVIIALLLFNTRFRKQNGKFYFSGCKLEKTSESRVKN